MDFVNNIMSKSMLLVTHIKNNTIVIRNNNISDCSTCISFNNNAYIVGKNHVNIQNNHLTNIPTTYNHIKEDNMYSKYTYEQVEEKISNKCKFTIDSSNTLTNCGFTIDADIKN